MSTSSDSGTINDFLWRNLPSDIIAHVLSLLPIKSLCRFKCVSPSWNSLISSLHFTKTNKRQKTLLISYSSYAFYSVDLAAANPTAEKLDFPSAEEKWIRPFACGSCNGLVLVSDDGNKHNFYMLNPFTRECKKLPQSPFFDISPSARIKLYPDGTHFFLPGLGYDSSTDDYKVVMLLYNCIKDFESNCDGDVNSVTNVTIYSLKNDGWRRIQDCHYVPVYRLHGVLFNERLHWLCWRTGSSDDSKVVVAFDLADEIFREVQLPTLYDADKFETHDIVVLGGCLCLVIWTLCFEIEVWMMKKYGVRESWIKSTIANHEMSLGHVLYLSAEKEFVLDIMYENIDCKKLVVYNPKNGTLRNMVVSGIPTMFSAGGNYIETLISPSHRGRIRRQFEASSGECSKSYQVQILNFWRKIKGQMLSKRRNYLLEMK